MPAPQASHRPTTKSRASKRPSKATTTAPTESAPRYHFIGGKGGVGKTTCAAAIAIEFARGGARTLVMSTDPAPSLGDALNRPLCSSPRRIPLPRAELHAMEVDAHQVLRRWLKGRRETLAQIALRGTWLDEEDVSRLLRLSLPGIDEFAALLEIARVARGSRYDCIVVDTAPTGHTLRLLRLPEMLRAIAAVFDRMQSKHRVMAEAIRGEWTPDRADALVSEIDREGRDLARMLRDPASTRVSWVTLPEMMAVEETRDALTALSADRIPVHRIIVNRLTPAPAKRCGWCEGRRRIEGRAVASLEAQIPDIPRSGIVARVVEPRGARELGRIGSEIAASRPVRGRMGRTAPSPWRAAKFVAHSNRAVDAILDRDRRILMFGGKGGVGKTTCAAAAAVSIASSSASRSVFLFSSDPAHSLGDVLGGAFDPGADRAPGGPPNLHVREIDAAAHFQQIRARYASSIDALFDKIGGVGSGGVGVDASHDRAVMRGLMDLAPPGIDELAAIVDVIDAVQVRPEALIVIDTAPTGHALRLLEMPALVQDWTKAVMSILLKYQSVAPMEEFGPALLNLSRGLGRLRAMLVDGAKTSCVVVTRAATLPREETRRLLHSLRKLRIDTPAVVVNAVGRGNCRRCRSEAAAESRQVARLARELPARAQLLLAPAELPPPHAPRQLRDWRRAWRAY